MPSNSPARRRTTLALDAMGGDYAPREILRGAVDVARAFDVEILLVGPRTLVEQELLEIGGEGPAALPHFDIVDAPEVVSFRENPSLVRERRGASIRVICDLVREGRAAAAVTMGHTGAGVIAASLSLGRLGRVSRPCVAVPYFELHPHTLLLDAGAIVDCKPEHLVQFAFMGAIYVEQVLGIARPTVALMANGREDNKGDEVTKAAFSLLKQTGLNFIGNVEGYDLPRGTANVIVMDGLVGNVALKLSEALAEELFERLARRMEEASPGASAAAVLNEFRAAMDYSRIGAMPVLGVDGLILIGHGRSRAPAVVGAIRSALHAVQAGLLPALREGLR